MNRRKFLSYVAPVIITLSATPALASAGSHHRNSHRYKYNNPSNHSDRYKQHYHSDDGKHGYYYSKRHGRYVKVDVQRLREAFDKNPHGDYTFEEYVQGYVDNPFYYGRNINDIYSPNNIPCIINGKTCGTDSQGRLYIIDGMTTRFVDHL